MLVITAPFVSWNLSRQKPCNDLFKIIIDNNFQLNAKRIARQVFVFVGKILNSLSSEIANLSSCGYFATRSTSYVLQWGCWEPKSVALVTAKVTKCFE